MSVEIAGGGPCCGFGGGGGAKPLATALEIASWSPFAFAAEAGTPRVLTTAREIRVAKGNQAPTFGGGRSVEPLGGRGEGERARFLSGGRDPFFAIGGFRCPCRFERAPSDNSGEAFERASDKSGTGGEGAWEHLNFPGGPLAGERPRPLNGGLH